MSLGRSRIRRACWTLVAMPCVVALIAAPATATYKGRNGRVALAWLDNDQGAHFEAAYAIVTVPWIKGSTTGKNVVSCTSLDGCPQFSHPAYSPDGSQVVYTNLPFSASAPQPKSQLVLADSDGTNPVTITDPVQNYFDPSFTPSGQRLLFVRSPTASPGGGATPQGQIVTSNLQGTDIRGVTTVPGSDPKLSPNGRTVLFDHAGAIWTVGIGGVNPHKLIKNATTPDWSPNGRNIVYASGNYPKGKHTLFIARADGSQARFLPGVYPRRRGLGPLRNVDDPVFSPDGKQIAFSTIYFDESGDPYLMRVPVAGGRVKPLWNPGVLDSGGTDLGTSWQPLH
jgi:Tol biopolymer transport system component